MATKISADVASVVDITVRRNDSFYLKTELKNTDGTIYDIIDTNEAEYIARFEIYDANDVRILGFISDSDSAAELKNQTVTVTGSTATLVINSPATHMTLRSNTYKYKFYVKTTADNITNTVMVGKFKVVDI